MTFYTDSGEVGSGRKYWQLGKNNNLTEFHKSQFSITLAVAIYKNSLP